MRNRGCTGIGSITRPSQTCPAGNFSPDEIHRLHACHDKLLAHKRALFDHLTTRWRYLFVAKREWKQARPSVQVKLLPRQGETHILAQSADRIAKERSMRRRLLRAYIDRLADLKARKRR